MRDDGLVTADEVNVGHMVTAPDGKRLWVSDEIPPSEQSKADQLFNQLLNEPSKHQAGFDHLGSMTLQGDIARRFMEGTL